MSHIIYNQNKLICKVNIQADNQSDPLLRNNQLILVVHHFQYPCIFYTKIYNHFKHLINEKYGPGNIRLSYKNQQLHSDLPIGLFVENLAVLKVSFSDFEVNDPYSVIKSSWKKAFSAINSNKGCDYIYKKLDKDQLNKRIDKYLNGQAHNLQNENYEGYQGTNIMTRFLIQGEIIERKSDASSSRTVADLIDENIPEIKDKRYSVKSHGFEFDQKMTIKQFLEEWSYNDGYCYLKIDLEK